MIVNENPLIANSLWTHTSRDQFIDDSSSTMRSFDVLIIGGGFSGCSTAYHCAEKGFSVCLIEKETIGWGASGRNGGQVNPGLKELPEAIISYFGERKGKKIIRLSGGAPDYVFELIRQNRIECDSVQAGWIQASVGKKGLATDTEFYRQWSNFDAPVQLLSNSEISSLLGSSYYSGGFLDRRGGKLHPLKFVKGLAKAAQSKGVQFFQNTEVLGIKKGRDGFVISCSTGDFFSEKVLLATNGYGNSANGTLNRNTLPVQSIQLATSPLSDNLLKTIIPKGHVISDTRRLLKYFRIADNGRLLMGGRGGTSNRTITQQFQELQLHVETMFPALSEVNFDYAWGGNIALTYDHFPHISELENGIVSLSGFNGRGIAMATVLGRVVSDFFRGVPSEDLDYPIRNLKPLTLPTLQKKLLPLAILYKKFADHWDI